MLAEYQCLRCGHEWLHQQGGSKGWTDAGAFIQPHPPPAGCPVCGHIYIKWLNYSYKKGT